MEIIGQAIFGTAKEFEDNGVLLNGKPLTQIAVGALATHGVVEYFGEGPKPARGRTPKVYKAMTRDGLKFELPTE